jgi:N-acetylglucosamine-6-phosphate deacetylase
MIGAMRNAVRIAGLPLEAAAVMASGSPAQFLGLGGELGQIAPGRRASLVAMDADLTTVETWIDGKRAG